MGSKQKRKSRPEPVRPPVVSDRTLFFLIAGIAMALRVAYAFSSRNSPFFDHLDLDSKFYDNWARQIAGGDWIGHEVFFMGPLYPYFLAFLYKIAGPGLLSVKVVQGIVGGFTAGGVFLLGKAVFNRTAGIIAGLLAAFYVPFIFYDSAILLPVLATFLNTFMLYFLIRGVTSGQPRHLFAAGLLAGLSAAGNASILAFAAVAALFVFFGAGDRKGLRARPALLFIAGIALIVLPITVRNAVVGHDFVPLTSNAGLNLYIGNNENATGAYVKPEGLDVYTDPAGKTIAAEASGRDLKPSEVSSWWAGRAGRFIESHPGRFAANLARKVFFFWSVYEVPQIEHLPFEKRYSGLLRIPSPSYGIICPLGIVGIILSFRRKKAAKLLALFIFTYSITIIAFFVVARYRLPMVPALMVLGAYSVVRLVDAAVKSRWREVVLVGAGITGLIIIVNTNFLGVNPMSGFAQSYYRLGIIHGLKGRPAEALESYRKALDLDPEIVPARVGLGILLSQAGKYAEAERELMIAAGLDSTYEKTFYNLGLVYSEEGKPDSALIMMQKALELKPDYMLARVGVAATCYEMGRLDEAGRMLTALKGDARLPESAAGQVKFLLGLVPERKEWLKDRRLAYQRLSDAHLLRGDNMVSILLVERALAEYREAVRLDSLSAPAYYQESTIYFRAGDLDRALRSLQQVLAADPDYRGANLAMGIIWVRKKDYRRACRAFEAELEVDPSSADAHINLAMCYENYLNNIGKAVYHLERYVEITGGTPEIKSHLRELKENPAE
jgi:tetratricopeptide (TPR) repeat protein/4-amino-4-deoxy-L-arabinose transferase-like glycosyltransferase